MSVTCVVGLQWGDEAKGKIVDVLAESHDIVVRYQGGANAGHTVVIQGQRHKMSLIPTGILRPAVTAVIGNGVVVDPVALLDEIAHLRSAGISVEGRLWVSDRAHVILPYHKAEEEVLERADDAAALGTTLRGIGPCYQDKIGRRFAIRVADLYEPAWLKARLHRIVEYKNRLLAALGSPHRWEAEELFQQCCRWAEQLRPYVIDSVRYLQEAHRHGKRILCEGAQGTLLDVDHGTYPYVTSSNSSVAGASAGTGLPCRAIDRVVGVVKAYTTRVGAGPFPTELRNELGQRIREAGNEYGTVTGRPRRCGWFDAVAAAYSARLCGVDEVAVMLLDVLTGLEELAICVGYLCRGKWLDTLPANPQLLEQCQPVYETLPGWNEEVSSARSWDELPPQAQAYLKRIEELLQAPISIVSVGPDRSQTIWLRPMERSPEPIAGTGRDRCVAAP
jgi:adenylosuccinate synthase